MRASRPLGRAAGLGLKKPPSLGALAIGLLSAACGLGLASVARANPIVDQGVEHYSRGEFSAALGAFDRAVRGNDLSRGELVQLVAHRVLIYYANDEEPQLRDELRMLVWLEPGFEFSGQYPPDLRARFGQIRDRRGAPLEVVVEPERRAGSLRVTATARGEAADLVRAVRLAVRSPVDNTWRIEDTGTAEFSAGAEATVTLYAEAIGPGGVVLASAGSADAPLSMSLAEPGGPSLEPPASVVGPVQANGQAPGPNPLNEGDRPTRNPGRGDFPYAWVAIGAGVVVTALAVAYLAQPSDTTTTLRPPEADWP